MPHLPLSLPFEFGDPDATGTAARGSFAARVPQFDLPFRFDQAGMAAVVEQDTVDDIANSVEAILRTRVGDRLEFPEFGSMDLLFLEQPIPVDALVAQIRQWEPRVDLLIEQDWDRFEETLVRLNIEIAKGD